MSTQLLTLRTTTTTTMPIIQSNEPPCLPRLAVRSSPPDDINPPRAGCRESLSVDGAAGGCGGGVSGASSPSSSKQSWWQTLSLKALGRRIRSESQSSGGDSGDSVQWYLSQFNEPLKGTDSSTADEITCLDFNENGELLAVGDRGGSIVILQRGSMVGNPGGAQYGAYSTFQSHEAEFDFRKSIEVDGKINRVRWMQRRNPAHFLLSTNDKVVKLWRVSEEPHYIVEGYNLRDESCASTADEYAVGDESCQPYESTKSSVTALRLPVLRDVNRIVTARPRRVFNQRSHDYHINSLSVNCDQESFLSADDLRVNVWHVDVSRQCFNIVDLKPENLESLSEVITAAEFHPTECSLFVYGSSKGCVRLCDMRSHALCDQHFKCFEDTEQEAFRGFFSDIISTVTDVRFGRNGQTLLTRDYLGLKVWDVRMEGRPLEVIQVQEYLRPRLDRAYEAESIYDKFEGAWSADDSALDNLKTIALDLDVTKPERLTTIAEFRLEFPSHSDLFTCSRFVASGSYNNFLVVHDRECKQETVLGADKGRNKDHPKPCRVSTSERCKKNDKGLKNMDFKKRLLHVAWHPTDDVIATSSGSNLYVFDGKR